MHIARIGLGIILALGMGACSRTSITLTQDGAVEVNRAFDAADDTRSVPTPSDTSPLGPDAAVTVADAAPLGPDAAVAVPDAVTQGPDSGLRDSAASTPDAATVVDGPDAPVLRDTAASISDSSGAPSDSLHLLLDSRETAANPYADRKFRIDPEHPAPTPDPSCTQYGPADYIELTFNSDLTTLTVMDVKGSALTRFQATVGPESNKLTYHVTDFLGGGLITIELDQGVHVAQLVLYGSGVPVVQCLRGALTPQP